MFERFENLLKALGTALKNLLSNRTKHLNLPAFRSFGQLIQLLALCTEEFLTSVKYYKDRYKDYKELLDSLQTKTHQTVHISKIIKVFICLSVFNKKWLGL
jgi:hypothetical protein